MSATARDYCGEVMRTTIDIVGGRWTMLVLWELLM